MQDTPINEKAQKLLLQVVNSSVEQFQSEASELRTKMEIIDIAYARYKSKVTAAGEDGYYDVNCDSEFDELRERFTDIDIPLLVSQVDTAVGYLADLYLSGYPIFPVVSEPKDRREAEYIEALIDKHATVGGYPAELLRFFWDACKYNVAPLLVEWDTMQHFTKQSQYQEVIEQKPSMQTQDIGYTKLKRLDPYNIYYDMNVSPGKAAQEGDHVGYVEIMSATKLHRLIGRLRKNVGGKVMNSAAVFKSANNGNHYRMHPQVSDYITSRKPEFSWSAYFESEATKKMRRSGAVAEGMFEVVTDYRRLVPKDYELADPSPEALRIYKIITVNHTHVLYVEPVYTPLEYLPILIGAPKDDGLGLQTQSLAEAVIPMQKAASALVNIRFHAARRAINDRALYDDSMINSQAINNPSASAKIPVNQNSLTTRKISDAYFSIPYDSRGTDTVMRDALMINDWTNELQGMNRAQQGQFQKGNKTQSEFNTVMDNAEMRQRLPAIMLEFQVMVPLKQMLKLNLWRYASNEIVRSQATGHTIEMDINQLDQSIFDFRVADGYLPKNKLASTEVLTAGMQMIQSSEPLMMQYGVMLPEIVAHMMTLGGVRGFDQYIPQQPMMPEQQQPMMPPTGEEDVI